MLQAIQALDIVDLFSSVQTRVLTVLDPAAELTVREWECAALQALQVEEGMRSFSQEALELTARPPPARPPGLGELWSFSSSFPPACPLPGLLAHPRSRPPGVGLRMPACSAYACTRLDHDNSIVLTTHARIVR